MKIITRGKGIKPYSEVKGSMGLDLLGEVAWIKVDTQDKKQYVIALTEFEIGQLLGGLLQHPKAVEVARRNGWLKGVVK